jgi:hypothetical protein
MRSSLSFCQRIQPFSDVLKSSPNNATYIHSVLIFIGCKILKEVPIIQALSNDLAHTLCFEGYENSTL